MKSAKRNKQYFMQFFVQHIFLTISTKHLRNNISSKKLKVLILYEIRNSQIGLVAL